MGWTRGSFLSPRAVCRWLFRGRGSEGVLEPTKMLIDAGIGRFAVAG